MQLLSTKKARCCDRPKQNCWCNRVKKSSKFLSIKVLIYKCGCKKNRERVHGGIDGNWNWNWNWNWNQLWLECISCSSSVIASIFLSFLSYLFHLRLSFFHFVLFSSCASLSISLYPFLHLTMKRTNTLTHNRPTVKWCPLQVQQWWEAFDAVAQRSAGKQCSAVLDVKHVYCTIQ